VDGAGRSGRPDGPRREGEDDQGEAAGQHEGRAAAEARGERAAGEDRGAEAPGVDRVLQPEGAAVQALGHEPLQQQADRHQEQPVAGAGEREGDHGERQDRRGARAQQAEPEQRDRGQVAARDALVVAAAEQRAAQHPAAERADERPEARGPGVQLGLGHHQLGDVGGTGDEHHGAGGGDERADDRHFQDAAERALVFELVRRRRRADMAAQPREQQHGQRERDGVQAEHERGSGDGERAGRQGGAEQLPGLAHGAEQPIGRAEVDFVDDRRQQRARRGAHERAAHAGQQGQGDQRDRPVGEHDGRERDRADQVGGDRAAQAVSVVDQVPECRAEEHRRDEVGE
jgi:hypothetical protein